MNMGKSGVPITAVREQCAHLLATQVTLHGALLCIEQPRSSTVSLHHPASPHSPLRLTRLNAPWMAAECRNLGAVCREGSFLLMVAHQAPKHFSQGEALGSSTNWNRFNEGHWRRTQPHQRISDVDPQVRNFPTVDWRQHCVQIRCPSLDSVTFLQKLFSARYRFFLQSLICLPFVPPPLRIKHDEL